MKKQSPEQISNQKQEFEKFYSQSISYIEKWFDFSCENVLINLRPIGLYDKLSFDDLERVVNLLKVPVDMNELKKRRASLEERREKLKAEKRPLQVQLWS